MKTVLLCGGLGTRLSEETQIRPKPMVEIGGRPILWHIMKIFGAHGFRDFILALGYKGEVIKDYFLNYFSYNSDVTVDLKSGAVSHGNNMCEEWIVRMIDTGKDTLTGGRLHRLEPYLRHQGTFLLTYGDGVADVDITGLLQFHRSHGKLATVTAVRPPARFGSILFEGDSVVEFKEKPQIGEGWINGGFFVFEPGAFEYLQGDQTVLEGDPLERLAADRQLMGFRHYGFWHPMDTLRDKNVLEALWTSGNPPWRIWKSESFSAAHAG